MLRKEPQSTTLYYSPHFNFRCIVENIQLLCFSLLASRFSLLASRISSHHQPCHISPPVHPFWAQTRAFLQCSPTLRGKTPTYAHLHQRHFIHQRDESFLLQKWLLSKSALLLPLLPVPDLLLLCCSAASCYHCFQCQTSCCSAASLLLSTYNF